MFQPLIRIFREFIIVWKYKKTPRHQHRILFIVLFSISSERGSSSSFMIASIVSRACRLYGITVSGNSLCNKLQSLQYKRRIISVVFPGLSLNLTPRGLLSRTVSFPWHIGHVISSFERVCILPFLSIHSS